MKRTLMMASLLLALAAYGAAQTDNQATPTTETKPAQSNSPASPDNPAAPAGSAQSSSTLSNSHVPQGTEATSTGQDAVVQPVAKPVKVTPDVIRSAQAKLKAKGLYDGPEDGQMGPKTRAAILQFQNEEKMPATGRLDPPTMAKLGVGTTQNLSAGASDIGRGGKAFGHDIKGGHPVEAGKALGKGAVVGGKAVGEGVKSGAIAVKDKASDEVSKVGRKVSGKSKEEKDKEEQKTSDQQNPPQQTPPPNSPQR